MTKLYFIAGEASGDFLGSKIISNLLEENKDLKIYGIGGDKMLAAGLKESLFPMNKISLMGIFEVLWHVLEIRGLIKKTVEHILKVNPQVLITIDSPGFNFRVVEEIKKLAPHIVRVHVVAPSVWAYKPERAIKTAWIYNHLLTLLPFEPPLFEKYGLKSDFIGHPIFEQDFDRREDPELTDFVSLSKEPIIAITPGSRVSEIKMHLRVFASAVLQSDFPEAKCIIVCASEDHKILIQKILKGTRLQYITTLDKIAAFHIADLVIAKSGTNTLEIAACETPMIVGYKFNILTWQYLKRLLKVKYASLINIFADHPIIPELIQNNCKPEKISEKLNSFIKDSTLRKNQVIRSSQVLEQMGLKQDISPAQKAAELIGKYIKH